MLTPRIEMNIEKIEHNAKSLVALYATKGVELIGVTKAVCGNPVIAQTLLNAGIQILADSRIENIKRMRDADIESRYLLLRTPFLSQAEDVVKYADISLNSEISVIKRLSKYAVDLEKNHKIILMIELGDLREGVMPHDLDDNILEILTCQNIELIGIGTNLACFGGVKPDDNNMGQLSKLATSIEEKFNISLNIISAGNSANYDWFTSTKNIGRINNLRIGESIYLGCETLNRTKIDSLYTNAFALVAEVIEAKLKPSQPYGIICQDAFGNVTQFKDRGDINRVILGVGLQDIQVSGLKPRLDIDILGASSDHLIVDAKKEIIAVGDELKFDLNYSALLSAMSSPYVSKVPNTHLTAQEYCEKVEQHYRQIEHALPHMLIDEDYSPLISLLNAEFNLVYEPSFKKDYQYKVREGIYDKIGRISAQLNKDNKQLIIRSSWRSYEHQRMLWEDRVEKLKLKYPKKHFDEIEELVSYFIARPGKSMHSTGGAIDALIFDTKKNEVMNFGTNKGLNIQLNDKCYPFHPNISDEAKRNRKQLIDLFVEEDFVVDSKEYWHFDFGNKAWAIAKEKTHAIYGNVFE
jgi:predicted amino acid racemase/D-alanyl-D-alanine dipeptidase